MKNIFKQILVIIITMVISISTINIIPVNADGIDVEINATNFPDEAFRTWLQQKSYGVDGKITQAEIVKIKTIRVMNKSNIQDLTGIEHFTALTELNCPNTGITSLDVSKNTALTTLYCNDTGITSLDVSKNTALTKLDCSNTEIMSLDVSNNTSLTSLSCYKTGITSLDVSKNTVLTYLHCTNTGIGILDVSKNTVLSSLHCYNTGITSLDVSKNTALTTLYCSSTPLAYLNIGQNNNLTTVDASSLKTVELEMTEDTFNMTEKFAGIDKSKITVTSGADYDSTTGVMSHYKAGTPITYIYDCGTSSGGTNQEISVTLNLTDTRTDSTISITDDLSKTYDKTAVSATPTVSKTGSTGDVSYKWERKKNASEWETIASAPTDAGTYRVTATVASDSNYKGATSQPKEFTISQASSRITITVDLSKPYDKTPVGGFPAYTNIGSTGAVTYRWERKKNASEWETISSAPTDAGTYQVTATVASDSNYKGATSDPKEFTISQADNSWTDNLAITGWTYGATANEPTATATFGSVSYIYSDKEDGTYTDTVPTNAGTWYVKAKVEETDNYKALTSDAVSFEITKAQAPAIVLPDNLSGVYDAKLSTVDLPTGWTWVDGNQILKVHNSGYKARLEVDDSNYNYTIMDGYHSENHYVEKTLSVTVAQATNSWIDEPVINDWIYGETANTPTATAQYGEVKYAYSDSENGIFTDTTPTNAGTWYIKVSVSATDDYTGLNQIVEFKIKQAENSWINNLTIADWTYGNTVNDPTSDAKFGTSTYTYSDSESGIFISTVPRDAGTWYVKASVAETNNYKGLEAVKKFRINKATAPAISLPSGLNGVYGNKLATVVLPDEWIWVDGNQTLKVHNSGYKARLRVDDRNYNYTIMDGYNSKEHYVEKTLSVTVAQATNGWIDEPVINDWIYGETANTPTATAQYGEVKYTYSDSESGTFIDSVPTNTGTWYVKASISATDDYTGLNQIVEFKIKQAENSWIDAPIINDWTYGETANTPTATAQYGEVKYAYSDSREGRFTDTVPTNAGTWYVKASVAETNNYKGLEAVKEFRINKATAPAISLPSGLNGVYGNKLATVVLPDEWIWVDGNQTLKVHNSGYKARLRVDDRNYNYTIMDGYNSKEHYVEKTLSVTVAQATNGWIDEPVINDWIYGETANTPTASAQYGEVKYTYSDSESGTFIDSVPTNAGTWYVKASISETDDYTGLNKVIKFEINKATPDYTIPQDLKATYGDSLKDVTVPKGFSWNDETLSVGNVGVNTFTAIYTPNDDNYKTITNIFVNVTVSKASNEQTKPLSLDNWTFGDTPSLASVGFKYGQPRLMYSHKINGTYVEDVPTRAGAYYVKAVVDGTDNYSGVETTPVVFVIEQRNVEENSQFKIPDINSDSNLNHLTLKDGEKVLVEGTDYDIKKVQNGDKVTVTIQFKGNYNGIVTKNYTVENDSSHNQVNQSSDANKETDVKTDDKSMMGVWSIFMIISMGFVICLKKRKD
ncbi:MBG domain-containing protein [Candidatus Stoquefichus massiliensis]|uniref:MBG domain-containing protein n=1 Tax=Candidatus Stoquefichus massiliensis TaxID=1470350 RepID=UPI000677BCFE|nr:MBG domain-containing protein [Candidatus Stoquefichus massiliensis]